jgi:hypothetical protein
MTAVGLGGVLLAAKNGGRLGAVLAEPALAGKVDANAVRVDLGFVSAYIVTRGQCAAIVDTGTPGNADRIGDALSARRVRLERRAACDPDAPPRGPRGQAGAILERAPGATLWVGEADIPQVQAGRTARPLNDGDEVFGLQVVATPDTLGHISLFAPTWARSSWATRRRTPPANYSWLEHSSRRTLRRPLPACASSGWCRASSGRCLVMATPWRAVRRGLPPSSARL